MKDAGFSCVLNDTSQVIGSWDHSLDWVLNEWAPQAGRAGVQHFAMITTPESFAEGFATAFFSKVEAFEVKVFDNIRKAEDWLRQYSLK